MKFGVLACSSTPPLNGPVTLWRRLFVGGRARGGLILDPDNARERGRRGAPLRQGKNEDPWSFSAPYPSPPLSPLSALLPFLLLPSLLSVRSLLLSSALFVIAHIPRGFGRAVLEIRIFLYCLDFDGVLFGAKPLEIRHWKGEASESCHCFHGLEVSNTPNFAHDKINTPPLYRPSQHVFGELNRLCFSPFSCFSPTRRLSSRWFSAFRGPAAERTDVDTIPPPLRLTTTSWCAMAKGPWRLARPLLSLGRCPHTCVLAVLASPRKTRHADFPLFWGTLGKGNLPVCFFFPHRLSFSLSFRAQSWTTERPAWCFRAFAEGTGTGF